MSEQTKAAQRSAVRALIVSAGRWAAGTIGDLEHRQAIVEDRWHQCHWTGCVEQIPPAMWGCRPHWFRLPKVLRDRIWAAYRPGQEQTGTPSEAYLRVACEVQEWIAHQGVYP